MNIQFVDNPLAHGYFRCCGNTYDPRRKDYEFSLCFHLHESHAEAVERNRQWLSNKIISYPMGKDKDDAAKHFRNGLVSVWKHGDGSDEDFYENEASMRSWLLEQVTRFRSLYLEG